MCRCGSKQTCKEQARDMFDTWTTLPNTGSRMHSFSHESPILHVLYSSLLQTSSQKHDAQCSMLRLLSALLPRAANLPPPAGVSSYLVTMECRRSFWHFLKDSYSQRLRGRLTTLQKQTPGGWKIPDFFIFSFACLLVVDIIQHIISKKGLSFALPGTVNTAFLTHYCLRHHSVHHCFITN
jgi:hypothetical protein